MNAFARRGIILLLASLAGSAAHSQQASCDRACLTKFIDAYYAALIANNPAGLPQAAQARITENSHEKKLAEVFWPAADAVAYRFDVVNIRRGDTGTQ